MRRGLRHNQILGLFGRTTDKFALRGYLVVTFVPGWGSLSYRTDRRHTQGVRFGRPPQLHRAVTQVAREMRTDFRVHTSGVTLPCRLAGLCAGEGAPKAVWTEPVLHLRSDCAGGRHLHGRLRLGGASRRESDERRCCHTSSVCLWCGSRRANVSQALERLADVG
jgi:hypothetical protein